MTCPRCQKKVRSTANYCPQCGYMFHEKAGSLPMEEEKRIPLCRILGILAFACSPIPPVSFILGGIGLGLAKKSHNDVAYSWNTWGIALAVVASFIWAIVFLSLNR